MKPAAFDYVRPRSVGEALELLGDGEAARPLAGGQSLVPAMNFRLAAPERLVDLNDISELQHIRAGEDGRLQIGAMTRQRSVERSALVARHAPLLATAIAHVAHAPIRNRGTVGGSIANADPAAEIPAVMLALDAQYQLQSVRGVRTVSAQSFHTGLMETALAADELLVSIEIPPLAHAGCFGFEEVARRPGDYALLGVAVQIGTDTNGVCDCARIALLSAGPHALLAREAASALMGVPLDGTSIERAAQLAAGSDIDPQADLHASVPYRRQLANVLTKRALNRALRLAEG